MSLNSGMNSIDGVRRENILSWFKNSCSSIFFFLFSSLTWASALLVSSSSSVMDSLSMPLWWLSASSSNLSSSSESVSSSSTTSWDSFNTESSDLSKFSLMLLLEAEPLSLLWTFLTARFLAGVFLVEFAPFFDSFGFVLFWTFDFSFLTLSLDGSTRGKLPSIWALMSSLSYSRVRWFITKSSE